MQWLGRARTESVGYRATPEAKTHSAREAAERLGACPELQREEMDVRAYNEPDAPVLASDVIAWLKQAGCSTDASQTLP